MNKLLRILALLGLPVLAMAQQNTFTTTTLSAAITSTQTTFNVASGTGINGPSNGNGPFNGGQGTLGSALYIDRELVQVTSISSTTVSVQRGQYGTAARSHASGALVYISGDPTWFSQAAVGTAPAGTCTLSTLLNSPDIHVLDGTIWACGSDGLWGFGGLGFTAYGAPNVRKTTTASYAALYWDSYIGVGTISAGVTITLPAAAAVPGKIYFIVDEAGDAASHTITVTTASGCASITTNNGSCRVRSNGTAYIAF